MSRVKWFNVLAGLMMGLCISAAFLGTTGFVLAFGLSGITSALLALSDEG